jgi:hypothetical protein
VPFFVFSCLTPSPSPKEREQDSFLKALSILLFYEHTELSHRLIEIMPMGYCNYPIGIFEYPMGILKYPIGIIPVWYIPKDSFAIYLKGIIEGAYEGFPWVIVVAKPARRERPNS